MIRFEGVTKSFPTMDGGRKVIADNINLTIPSGVSMALLGRNGAGKSTLMEIIGGRMAMDSGRIVTSGTISWPVGFSGSFNGEMTGVQNIRFIARIYGVDTDSLVDFVADFAELGSHLYLPVRTYSSGMKSRVAFGVSLGIPFDTYLVDEVTSVGDTAFRQKAQTVFDARMQASGAIVVSHSVQQVRKMCQVGAVLEQGKLSYFDDIEEAIACHEANMEVAMEDDA